MPPQITFEEDPIYLNWCDQQVSDGTLAKYFSSMRAYLEFLEEKKQLKLTPSELIDRIEADGKKARKDQGEIEREWVQFAIWLTTEYKKFDSHGNRLDKPMSYQSARNIANAIKTFYKHFGFPLSEIAHLPPKIRGARGKLENQKVSYRPETVRRLINAMKSNRDKAITLVMFQSGMDISTTLSLTFGQIRRGLERGECPLMLKVQRPKVGTTYRTFIAQDAIDAIKVHLAERTYRRYRCQKCDRSWELERKKCPPPCNGNKIEEYSEELDHNTPLFASSSQETKKVKSYYQDRLRKFAVIAGIITEEELKEADINPARPHALRAGFSSIMVLQGVNQQLIDYFLGHTSDPYGGAYFNAPDEQLRELYSKHMEHLSITEVREIADVEEKFQEELTKRDELIKELSGKNESMEERLSNLEGLFHRRARVLLEGAEEDEIQAGAELLEFVETQDKYVKRADVIKKKGKIL